MSEESLKLKQKELDCLQQSFDDYVESSKEFEGELELALKSTEDKLTDVTNKKVQTDSKLMVAQEKLTQLSKELQHVQNDLGNARGKLGTAEESTKKLESSNDALKDRVRILEATEGSPYYFCYYCDWSYDTKLSCMIQRSLSKYFLSSIFQP